MCAWTHLVRPGRFAQVFGPADVQVHTLENEVEEPGHTYTSMPALLADRHERHGLLTIDNGQRLNSTHNFLDCLLGKRHDALDRLMCYRSLQVPAAFARVQAQVRIVLVIELVAHDQDVRLCWGLEPGLRCKLHLFEVCGLIVGPRLSQVSWQREPSDTIDDNCQQNRIQSLWPLWQTQVLPSLAHSVVVRDVLDLFRKCLRDVALAKLAELS